MGRILNLHPNIFGGGGGGLEYNSNAEIAIENKN